MVNVNRRLFAGSIAVAAVIAVGGGWALASSGDNDGGDQVSLDQPGVVQDPTLGTNAPVQGDQLPEITLQDTDGNEVALRSLTGEPLVLNFWSSGCQPCKKEMPELGAASTELEGKVRFVGVNIGEKASTAQDFADEHGAGYLQLLDPNGELSVELGVGVQPTTLFVSADGTVVVQRSGELSADKLDTSLAEAFGLAT
jgi:peroxiredoxin